MNATIILCGFDSSAGNGLGSEADIQVLKCPSSLDAATASDLNSILVKVDSASAAIVFADANLSRSGISIDAILSRFDQVPHLAGLSILPSSSPAEHRAFDALPAGIAAFLPAVARRGIVAVRRSATDSTAVGEFQHACDPLRAWLIRAALSGHAIEHQWEDFGNDTQFTASLPSLRPSRPARAARWVCAAVDQLDESGLVENVRSNADAVALKAGLLQVNDLLHESHEFSQSVQGEGIHADGDYWHAVMHRREPDYSNAKYWFRRVDAHPIFPELAQHATCLLEASSEVASEWNDRLIRGGRWDPSAFVDLCQACPRSETDELSRFGRNLQWIEMLLLLRHTYRDAIGDGK